MNVIWYARSQKRYTWGFGKKTLRFVDESGKKDLAIKMLTSLTHALLKFFLYNSYIASMDSIKCSFYVSVKYESAAFVSDEYRFLIPISHLRWLYQNEIHYWVYFSWLNFGFHGRTETFFNGCIGANVLLEFIPERNRKLPLI